jgi:hypothetical protein
MGMGMDMFDEYGAERPRSAPVMGMGRGGVGGYPMGMPPRMGGGGMGMGPGPQANMNHHHSGMDLPPGYSPMPPHYSPGGPGPYPYPASPGSSTSTARTRRPSGAHERIPMGAYAKPPTTPSPKLSRAHTSPAPAKHKPKPAATGGKEWLKGDDFLDLCTCTPNCTCRQGHRVLYRSRNDPDSDSEAATRYNSGEIRYILKQDLGKDCGDHSGCKKAAESSDESTKEKEKKEKKQKRKEEKKRKEEYQEFKEDMLDALDERVEAAIKKAKSRSSRAGSVSSPKPGYAGLRGAPFAMGREQSGMDARMGLGQNLGGMGMGMPPTTMGGNPYAMGRQGMNYMPPPGMGGPPGGNPFTMGIQGMGKVPPGMGDAMRGGHPMRPGSMPMGGMGFDDHDSMADMEGMAMGNPYAGPMRGRRMRPAFMSPRHRDAGVMGMDAMFRGKGTGINRRGRGGGRQQRQRNSLGSDDIDLGPSRPDSFKRGRNGRESSFNARPGKFACNSCAVPTSDQHQCRRI